MARNTRATKHATNYYTNADDLSLSSTPVDAHITGLLALPHKSLIPTARRVPTRQRACVCMGLIAFSLWLLGTRRS
jgi:hypothetical protein